MRRFSTSARLPATVSLFAMATAFAVPAYAQAGQQPAPAPVPEACANIKDEAQKQACAQASEQVDPLANQGEVAESPTQGGTANAEATPGERGQIVVTGSRLRRDERTSADPVAVIDPNVQAREGRIDVAEVLLTNPLAAGSFQITSTISSNFVVNGGEGVQTVSLRGLGANRTLTLLNGRRAGPAGVRGGVSAFDLNVIPIEGIQSIEILKTGASSIYGSDAIAGVVNLITKKDLRGLQLTGRTSYPTHNGGEQYNISALYGMGIGDRGHVMIGVDKFRQNDLARGDRDFLGCTVENVTNPAGDPVGVIDPRTGEPACGTFSFNQLQLVRGTAIVNGVLSNLMSGNNLLGPCVPGLPEATTAVGCPAGSHQQRRAIGAIQFNAPGD
jgi:iron complex outermembrane recepter protein